MSNDWYSVKPVGCKPWLVLPAVYGDALSYGDQIAHFCAALNKLIQNNNTLPEYIQQMIQAYINGDVIGEVVQNIVSQFILNVKYPPENLKPAVGDGSADDTEAIQGCINYAKNHNGMAVYIPSGAYSVQSLTLPGDVSLFGFDRYTTKLVLRGGATTPMISSAGTGFSIIGLTLDGNAGVQVEDINILSLISQDVLLRDLIIKDGYQLLVYNGTGGHLQMDNIVFGNTVYRCVNISGNSIVQASGLRFTQLSAISGEDIINVSSDGGMYALVSTAVCKNGVVVSGNDNYFSGLVSGATNSVVDSGLRNNIDLIGNQKTEYYENDVDVTVEKEYGLTTNGAYSENISGAFTSVRNSTESKVVTGASTEQYNSTQTENITSKKTINAEDIYLNPSNPLQYKTPKKLNEYFNYIEFKDNNSPYKILVEGDSLTDFKNINNSFLPTTRIFRRLKLNDNFNDSSIYVVQGFTATNNNYYATYYGSSGTKSIIEKYDLTGELINSVNTPIQGHANSLCNNGSNLYIANYSTSEGYTNIITIMDLNLNSISNKPLTGATNVGAVAYDKITQKLYAIINRGTICEITENESDFTIENSIVIPNMPLYTAQGFCVNNGICYLLNSFYNILILFDLNTENITMHNIFPLADYAFQFNEVEDIEYINGDLLFSSYTRFGAGSTYSIAQFIKTSLTNSIYMKNLQPNNSIAQNTIYVGEQTSNNPDGTQDNPFSILSEAVEFSKNVEKFGNNCTRIRINVDNLNEVCSVVNLNNKQLAFNNHKIGGLYLLKCNNIMISGPTFDSTNVPNQINSPFWVQYSNGVIMTDYSSIENTNLQADSYLYCGYSNLLLSAINTNNAIVPRELANKNYCLVEYSIYNSTYAGDFTPDGGAICTNYGFYLTDSNNAINDTTLHNINYIESAVYNHNFSNLIAPFDITNIIIDGNIYQMYTDTNTHQFKLPNDDIVNITLTPDNLQVKFDTCTTSHTVSFCWLTN